MIRTDGCRGMPIHGPTISTTEFAQQGQADIGRADRLSRDARNDYRTLRVLTPAGSTAASNSASRKPSCSPEHVQQIGVFEGVERNGGSLGQSRVGDLLALEGFAVDHPRQFVRGKLAVCRFTQVEQAGLGCFQR